MAKNKNGHASKHLRLAEGDALLIIDTINDLEFPGGEKVLPWALKLADRLAPFRNKVRRAGVPVIYVNDNFQQWRDNFTEIYDYCIRRSSRGRELARKMKPGRTDYFILKPQQSAFYATSLVPLLDHLKVKRLILSGIATNLCVMITAHDAQMRRYPMIILSDCCAAESDFDHDQALDQLKRFCNADVCLSTELQVQTLHSHKRAQHKRPAI